MNAFKDFAERWTPILNATLHKQMPSEDERPVALHKAMRYSLLAGGKRLRPLLCLASCEAAGGKIEDAIIPSIAIEALHTYTLIHDDLPCMDDDDMRRGKPACHVMFGEAAAVLTGDALLTLAFDWLARAEAPAPYPPCAFVLELAAAAGNRGIIAGQMEDMAAEGSRPDLELVEYIHSRKTARLIEAAARLGAIAAAVDEERLNALGVYGRKLGLAFQIVDDILNETSTPEQLGKAAGSDKKRGKVTFVAATGIEAARAAAKRLSSEAAASLCGVKLKTETLLSLASSLLEREH